MEKTLQREDHFRRALLPVRILYTLGGICVAVLGIYKGSAYQAVNACGTLALIPALILLRKWLKIQGGWELETHIYLFIFLSWTLGGAAGFYSLIPYFDKAVHCLSGVFVSMLALGGYRMLEPDSRRERKYRPAAYLFVFFASMATAGIFELCEFTLSPILQMDLQHVLDTGVADTMQDMLVCMVGTFFVLLLMVRASCGKHDPITGAAEALAEQNS